MRVFLAGIFLLLCPAVALAQVSGQVLEIGIQNNFRPDAWIPLLVQLTSHSADAQEYQIQVIQEDLDGDRATYTQPITLGGGGEAQTNNFWVYFRPKPIDGGLPDAHDSTLTLAKLTQVLKVVVTTRDGKPVCTVPMTATALSVDPLDIYAGQTGTSRARRFIVCVTDGGSVNTIPDFSTYHGMMEDVQVATVRPRDLPNNVLGYEGVDDIVWMDADANTLMQGTLSGSLEAIRQWVHQGGHLVICQPPLAARIRPFADMLPVGDTDENGQWTIRVRDRTDSPETSVLARLADLDPGQRWPSIMGPDKVAHAAALPGALVEEWMIWPDGSSTPWLARRPVGLGAVTWVAQDLGATGPDHKALQGAQNIWSRVLGLDNPHVRPLASADEKDPWMPGKLLDLGLPFKSGLDLTNTTVVLLGFAFGFFIIYWLVAGLGVHFFLASRKRAHLSWFYFALSALVATALTILLVKLLVRGPPQLKHLTVIRSVAGETDAVADSRFGLYIPQDGSQKIDVGDTAPHQVSWISALSPSPHYLVDADTLPAYLEYQIPVRSDSDDEPLSISVPYRSSSKKFQVHWIGDAPPSIVADPAGGPLALADFNNHLIRGRLRNVSGHDLVDVYIAVRARPSSGTDLTDWMVYIPAWKKGDPLDLTSLFIPGNEMNLEQNSPQHRKPEGADIVWGTLDKSLAPWEDYWSSGGEAMAGSLSSALPVVAFFDVSQPWKAADLNNNTDRWELFRRGARQPNVSAAVTAGDLAVIGIASDNSDITQSPIPIPLQVNDSDVKGTGTTVFETLFSLDRRATDVPPVTQPNAAKSATQPSAAKP